MKLIKRIKSLFQKSETIVEPVVTAKNMDAIFKTETKEELTEEEIQKFSENIEKAIDEIKNADAILIHAGAGMSVDTGIPPYRGKFGIYENNIIIDGKTLKISDLTGYHFFMNNPEMSWAYHGSRIKKYKNMIPHKGFDILKNIVNKKNNNYYIFTTNVDNQFIKAGFDTNKIMEAHGSLFNYQEAGVKKGHVWRDVDLNIEISKNEFKAVKPLPTSPKTGKLARPNVLMFDDVDFNPTIYVKQEKRMREWLNINMQNNKRLVIIEIGSGKKIPIVRIKSERVLETYRNSKLIRINPEDSDVPVGQISLPFGALATLNEINKRLQSK